MKTFVKNNQSESFLVISDLTFLTQIFIQSRRAFRREWEVDPGPVAMLNATWKILGGFWDHLGGQVGAKLASKTDKNGVQDDIQKRSRKTEG